MDKELGKLYLVATPIGNLEDITFRALRVLKEVDVIAAEDTRHTIKLLNYYQIKSPLMSYFQHNERERTEELLRKLSEGVNIALVSDAGMPGISDPGNHLVEQAIKLGVKVVPIPGASAVISALAVSGLDTSVFRFCGFLPRKSGDQMTRLQELSLVKETLVFFEGPHRLISTLTNIFKVFGNRKAVLAKEVTKIHEDFIRGSLEDLLLIDRAKIKGEFTIVIDGYGNETPKCQNPLIFGKNINNSNNATPTSLRAEMRAIAQKTGKKTSEIYEEYLLEKKNKEENPPFDKL